MKKYLIIILLAFTIVLTSCGGGSKDTNTRIDEPSNELYTALNLESVENGKTIKEVDTTKSEYYSIKIAEDAKSTLFVYSTNIDAMIEAQGTHLESFNVNPLTFSSQITTTETTKIMSELFDTETGITSETLGVDFNLKASTKWTRSIDADVVVDAYFNQNQRNNCVAIVYLPVQVEHVESSKTTLKVFVMIPVYYEITTYVDGVIQGDAFKNIPTQNFTFTEDNLLK